MARIAVSIMCADQPHLAGDLKKLGQTNVKLLHCDVMGGVYINNLTLDPEYFQTIRQVTTILLDIHLATISQRKYIEMFAPLQREYISFHKVSITENLQTPINTIYPYLDQIDVE